MNIIYGLRRAMSVASTSLVIGLLSHPVYVLAQAADTNADGDIGIQEITVTAQRRSENVQRVPIAISVLSGDQASEANAVSAVDLNALVPGMQVVSSGPFAMTSIRGIGTQQINAFGDPVVGYNVDGVIQDRSINASAAFFDIDRIEVLKGPQGTLYGRNATAGAINVITKKPTHEFGGNVQVDFGNYNSVNTTGAFNAPISDVLAARFAFQTIRHSGYFSDGTNDANEVAGRVHLLYTPTDKLSLLLTLDALHQGGKGPEDEPLPFGSGGQDPSDPWNQHFYHDASDNAYPQSVYRTNPYTDNKFWGVQGQLDWDFGPATLTFVPGYHYTRQNQFFYYGGIYEYADNPTHQTTVELRLANSASGNSALTWVAGLYYYRLTQQVHALYGLPCFCADDASATYVKSPNNVGRNLSDLDSLSYAPFGQVTYAIRDNLRLTAGLRYTHDEKTENGQGLINIYTLPLVTTFIDQGNHSWRNVSWKAGVDYDLSPSSMVYANVSTGYKAGGLNEGLNATPYNPERLTAFAVGSKNRIWDNRIQLNTELFYWRYVDHQVASVASVDPPPNIGYIGVNIPRSRTYGADVDLSWRILSKTQFDFSTEYLNGKTGAYTIPTSTGIDYVTNESPMISSPRWNLTGSLKQEWNLGVGSLSAAGRIHYTTRQLLYAVVTPDTIERPTATADLDLTYSGPKDAWYVRAYVKNVGNRAVLLSTQPGQSPRDFLGPDPFQDVRQYGFVGAPRTYGIHLGANF